jgi:hypothetical protein
VLYDAADISLKFHLIRYRGPESAMAFLEDLVMSRVHIPNTIFIGNTALFKRIWIFTSRYPQRTCDRRETLRGSRDTSSCERRAEANHAGAIYAETYHFMAKSAIAAGERTELGIKVVFLLIKCMSYAVDRVCNSYSLIIIA